MVTPFDLHVLSTPPAFILSQDQTLELILFPSDSGPKPLGFCSVYCSFFVRSFFLKFFWIFRVALLFICQGAVHIRFRCAFLSRAAGSYRTQLSYIITAVRSRQDIFLLLWNFFLSRFPAGTGDFYCITARAPLSRPFSGIFTVSLPYFYRRHFYSFHISSAMPFISNQNIHLD